MRAGHTGRDRADGDAATTATSVYRTPYPILAACGLAALSIVLVGWALLDASRSADASQQMVQRTEQVLRRITGMRGSLALAESGHRGFLLTGDPQFRDTREQALAQLRQERATLDAQLADDPAQRERSRRLAGLIEQRIAAMRATERIRSEQGSAAAGRAFAAAVTAVPARIVALVGELADEETRLLGVRQQHDRQDRALMHRMLGVAGLAVVAFLLPVLWGLLSQSRERHRAEYRLRTMTDSLPGSIFVLRRKADGAVAFEFLSLNASGILGIDRDHVLRDADAIRRVMLDEDRDLFMAAVARSAGDFSHLEVDFRVREPDGAIRWLRSSGIPAGQPDGDVVWSGYWADITDLKETEQALREATQRLDDAQSVAGLGDWTCDLATGALTWSPQTYRMLGRDPALGPPDLAEAVGLFENGAKATADAFFKAQESGERQAYELTSRMPEGGASTWHVIVLPTRDAAGAVVGMRGTIQDVSLRKALEERLYQEKEAADSANLAKSEFLATMSHEIRTPLSGMLGILELIGPMPLDPELQGAIEGVRESAKSLQRIIDDILDFSKVEAGKLEIRLEPTSLAEMAAAMQRIYSGSASNRGLELRHRVDPRISPAVMVDGLRLRQILGNFVSNAIKFTPRGHVELRISLLERDGNRESLCFEVEDTGIGVAADRQQRLFQPFEQAGLDSASRVGGTGLGLVISRRLARLMGGEVGMSSELGKGTTMSLVLTVTAADPRQVPRAREVAPLPAALVGVPTPEQAVEDGTLVLVVDDHPINRMVIRKQLNTLGYATEDVESASEALELWRSGRFALVVTDCNMPRMSGYDLSRRIRELEASGDGQRTPIIACSANVIRGSREACLEAGMDDYLPKPTRLLALAEVMQRWLPLNVEAGRNQADIETGEADAIEPDAVLDSRALHAVCRGDPLAEQRALEHFRRINDADIVLLEAAVGRDDLAVIVHLAHRIKGACGFVGAIGLASACARLEHAGRTEQGGDIGGLMMEFRSQLERLNAHIDARR